MAKQLMDDEVSLKRRARRRLIGAVALVIIIVVLLPMVLDSEPKLAGQNIELRIPDKDKVGEFIPKMGIPSEPVSEKASSSVAVTDSVSPSTPVVHDHALAASEETESKSAPAKTETKPAENVAIGNTPHTPQTGFVVQVGAFSNVDTAHEWQKKLSKQNIKVYTEKAGNKTRVRAGPYDTREAAESVSKKLKAQGMRPTVSQAY